MRQCLLKLAFSGKRISLLYRLLPFKLYTRLIASVLEIQGNQHAEEVVLCFSRHLFDKDFEQMSYRIRTYGWIWFNKSYVIAYHDKIPKKYRRQMDYTEGLNDPGVNWEKYISRGCQLLREIGMKKKIACFMVANIDYWQDYTLKVACRRLGIPVIALQKEFPISARNRNTFLQRYRDYDPIVDGIAVFGSAAKTVYENNGMTRYCDVVVTGAPRLDRWMSIETQTNSRQILLLSFRKGYSLDIESGFFDLVFSIVAKTKQLDDAVLLIKAKNAEDRDAIVDWSSENEILDHVEVSHAIPLYDAIPSSRVVIGYNSMALVEAMISDVPIFVPDWYTIEDERKMLGGSDGIGTGAVDFFLSEEELLAGLEAVFKTDHYSVTWEVKNNRESAITKFWEWEKGVSASSRVMKMIEKHRDLKLDTKKNGVINKC